MGPLGKTSFLICNSFSRSAEQPNRYRVILPFLKPCPSLAIFKLVHDFLVERIGWPGYEDLKIGLDRACRSGNQSFRVPCTNRNQRDWAFFRPHGLTTREFLKSAIYPTTYQEVQPITYSRPIHAIWNQRTKNVTPQFMSTMEGKKSELRGMKEGRHHKYFEFGIYLRWNGYSLDEIELELLDIAGTDSKMKGKAHYIMVSLHKYAGRNYKQRRR